MRKILARATSACVFSVSLVAGSLVPAAAQSVPAPGHVIDSAAMHDMLASHKAHRRAAAAAAGSKAPAGMVAANEEDKPPPEIKGEAYEPGFPGPRFDYGVDISSSFPYGNIGFKKNSLPGGVDVVLNYRIKPTTRVSAQFFTESQFPFQTSTGTINAYLQGVSMPITTASLYAMQPDTTTRTRLMILALEQIIFLNNAKDQFLVIVPSYAAARSTIGGKDDIQQIFVPQTGRVHTVHARSTEQKGIDIIYPYFITSKLFFEPAIGLRWLINTNGANQDNHAQVSEIALFQYDWNKRTSIFFQPSVLNTYFPTDRYNQHLPLFLYGFTHRFSDHGPFYVQGDVTQAKPTNPDYAESGRQGVVFATIPCQPVSLPVVGPITIPIIGVPVPGVTCVQNVVNQNAVPTIGGLGATTISIKFGYGNQKSVMVPPI